jgi:tetratricopeptide (TPR) repeat protein
MHELLGLIFIARKNNARALDELQKAEKLNPNDADIRYFFGRLLYALGRITQARDEFWACLKIQSNYRKALENLGLCYETLGDYLKATQAFTEAISLEKAQVGSKHGEPFGYYGAMLAKMGRPEEALRVLREGLAVCPDSFVINYELGRVLLTLNNLPEAEQCLLSAEKAAPKYARTYYLLGELHRKQHRLKEANQDWAKFEELSKAAENTGFPVSGK